MKHILRNKYLSRPRYNRYLIAVGNNKDRAKKLYNANIRLAQSFHPVLSQFEVVLRNCLNNKLSVYFADTDWIINQKNGFMRHTSLSKSHFFLKKAVIKTQNNLTRKGIPISSGKIISDQNFGFWIAFFLPHHYALIAGQPIHIFPNKPSIEDRASLYSKLDAIRSFRNRVNHCEPICFNGNHINCSEAIEIRNILYDLVRWINPDLISFFKDIDNTQSKIDTINSMKER